MPLVLDLSTKTGADCTYTVKLNTTVNIDRQGMEYRYPNLLSHQIEIKVRGLTLKETSANIACKSPYTKETFLDFFNSVRGTEIPFNTRAWFDYIGHPTGLYGLNTQSTNQTFSRTFIQPITGSPTIGTNPQYLRFVKGYQHAGVWGYKSLYRIESITKVFDQSGVLIPSSQYVVWNSGTNENGIYVGSYLERLPSMPSGTTPTSFEGTFYYLVRFKEPTINIVQVAQGLFQVEEFNLVSHVEAESFAFNSSDYPRQLTGITRNLTLGEDIVPQSGTVFAQSTTHGKPFQTYTFGWRNEYSEANNTGVKKVVARNKDNNITVASKNVSSREAELLLCQFLANKGRLLTFNYPYCDFGSTTRVARFDTDEIDFTPTRLDSNGCVGRYQIDKLAFRAFTDTFNPYLYVPPPVVTQGDIVVFNMSSVTTASLLATVPPANLVSNSKQTRTTVGNLTSNFNTNFPPSSHVFHKRQFPGLTSVLSGTNISVPTTTGLLVGNTSPISKCHFILIGRKPRFISGSTTIGTINLLSNNFGNIIALHLWRGVMLFRLGTETTYIETGIEAFTHLDYCMVSVSINGNLLTIDVYKLSSYEYNATSNDITVQPNVALADYETFSHTLTTQQLNDFNRTHASVYLANEGAWTTLQSPYLKYAEYGIGNNCHNLTELRGRCREIINTYHPTTSPMTTFSTPSLSKNAAPAPECYVFRADNSCFPNHPALSGNNTLQLTDIVGGQTRGNFAVQYGGTVGQQLFYKKTGYNNSATTTVPITTVNFIASTNSYGLANRANEPLYFANIGNLNANSTTPQTQKRWDNYYLIMVMFVKNLGALDSWGTQVVVENVNSCSWNPTGYLNYPTGNIDGSTNTPAAPEATLGKTGLRFRATSTGVLGRTSLYSVTSVEFSTSTTLSNNQHLVIAQLYSFDRTINQYYRCLSRAASRLSNSTNTSYGSQSTYHAGTGDNIQIIPGDGAFLSGIRGYPTTIPKFNDPVVSLAGASTDVSVGGSGILYCELGLNQGMTSTQVVSHFNAIAAQYLPGAYTNQ